MTSRDIPILLAILFCVLFSDSAHWVAFNEGNRVLPAKLGLKAKGKMMSLDLGFDVDRYRKLLAEAVDEKKRSALIDLLIKERAKGRLEAQRAFDRDATIADDHR
jgi:hypothetical protein